MIAEPSQSAKSKIIPKPPTEPSQRSRSCSPARRCRRRLPRPRLFDANYADRVIEREAKEDKKQGYRHDRANRPNEIRTKDSPIGREGGRQHVKENRTLTQNRGRFRGAGHRKWAAISISQHPTHFGKLARTGPAHAIQPLSLRKWIR